MKKTLVSIIVGLTVLGSAFAAPTPDAVKDMCLKHPDKYVWVEKTQACVPINPCESPFNSEIHEIYCKHFWVVDEDALNLVINRYVEKTFKTSVQSMTMDVDGKSGRIVFVKTKDGGYFVAHTDLMKESSVGATREYIVYAAMSSALLAYGCDGRDDISQSQGGRRCSCDRINSGDECRDVADFASLMADEIIYHNYNNGSCALFIE